MLEDTRLPMGLDQKRKVQTRARRGAGECMHCIKVKCYGQGRERTRYNSLDDSMNGNRLVRCLRRRKLGGSRNCPFATVVGIRRGKAFTLDTAGRGFACESASQAVEGHRDEDQDCHERHRNVNAPTHFNKRIADCAALTSH